MKYGKLQFSPAIDHPKLVAESLYEAAALWGIGEKLLVAPIDPDLADTAAFCEAYDVGSDVSANCVIVQARRAEKTWYAAVVVLATDRADINGVVRRQLDARKISFAPMESAVELTGMEYGGIAPIGLPDDWPILIDQKIANLPEVIIGSGIRGSKILTSGKELANFAGVTVLDLAKAQ